MESKDFRYTLDIKFDIKDESTSLIKMHFDHLQDAFDKLLMIQGDHFLIGFREKPFEKMTVSEVLITDNKDGKTLISSGIAKESFGDELKLPPGFYLRFPKSVAAFEQISNIDFSEFKSYDRDSPVLLAAVHIGSGSSWRYKPLIAYENIMDQVQEKLKNSTLYVVSFTKYFFESDGDYLRTLQPYPHREDYFFDNLDNALHKLLMADFNALDEQVAWERDLSSYISKAALYRNTDCFGDYWKIAQLHSARKYGLQIGHDRYEVTGIYLQAERDVPDKVKYPFSELEDVEGYLRTIYRVGLYNESLSCAEKIPELLTPFEKLKRVEKRNPVRKSPARKANGRSNKM